MEPFPTIFGYTIKMLVSEGSHARVYRARDRSGSRCAIKVFRRMETFQRDRIDASSPYFMRELELLALNHHPNWPRLLSFGQTIGRREDFIAMEWVDGEDFLSASRRASRQCFLMMLAQVCRALDHLHRRGYVHQDLKPQNLIVSWVPRSGTTEPLVTLMDFAYADRVGAPASTSLKGSPHYVAPEVIEGKQTTPASDLYSLGVILYECIVGTLPFHPTDIGSVLRRHLEGDIVAEAPATLREFDPIVRQLLSRDPAKRPATAAELLRSINAVVPDVPIDLQTWETYIAQVGSCPMVASGHYIEHPRRLLAEASDRHYPGVSRLILVYGARGAGRTRFLREMALKACRSGILVHLLVNPTTEDLHLLVSSYRDGTDPQADVAPILLIIDDAHQHTLGALLDDLPSWQLSRPIFLAIGVNTSDRNAASNIQRGDAPNLVHLPLPALGSVDVKTIIQWLVGPAEVPEDILASCVRLTGGNPWLLTRLLATALQSHRLVLDRGTLRTSGELEAMELSSDVPAHFEQVCASLSVFEKAVMNLLALVEVGMSIEDLASFLHVSVQTAAESAAQLSRMGVIVEGIRDPTRYTCASALLGRHLASALPLTEKRQLHSDFGRWALNNWSGRDRIEAAARHFHASGESRAAIHYSLEAAELAQRSGDLTTAVQFYQCALSHQPENGDLSAQIILGLASAETSLGMLQQAGDRLRQLAARSALSSSWRLRVELQICRTASTAGDYPAMERSARLAARLPVASHLLPELLEVEYHLGAALCRMGCQRDGLRILFRVAKKMLRHKLTLLRSNVMNGVANFHWSIGHYGLALKYLRRSACLRSTGSAGIALLGPYSDIAILQSDLGFFAKARRTHRAALAILAQRELGTRHAAAWNNIGETYRAQGRWPRALAWYRRAQSPLRGAGPCDLGLMVAANHAYVLAKAGYFSCAGYLLRGQVALCQTLGNRAGKAAVLLSWAVLLHNAGRGETCRKLAMKAIAFATNSGLSASVLEFKTLEALTILAQGDATAATVTIKESLAEYEHRSPFDVRLSARLASAQIDMALGLSAEAAENRVGPLLETCRKKKMAWHTTWALMLRGEARLAAGRSEEAEADLTEAIRIAQTNADRPSFWKAAYWLGRVFEQRLQYERALGSYRAAALTVQELARDIEDERYQESFLAQRVVQEVLARHRRLQAEVGKQVRHSIAAMSRSEKVSRRMLNALNAIGQKLSSILNLDDLLASLLDLSIENVRAERGMVFLRDPATGELDLTCARNMDRESLEGVSSFSRSVIKRVAEGHTLLRVDVGADPSLTAYKSLVIHEIKSILCVPMRTRGVTVGVIYLDTRKAAQMFTDKERTFVESFASQAAIAIENARLFGDVRAENARLRREVLEQGRFQELVGASPAMQRLSQTIAGILHSDCNVFIVGESGTGKELVARAIHRNGPRQGGAFVAVDCGALPENLLEAELFGFARGAFTGADKNRVGLFEQASGGTLFLDEITNMGLPLQAKLLRVLQEREVRRLGENTTRRVDVRVVAATNADVDALLKEGRLRPDLYYRLNVVRIDVPSLRDRRDDIPLLVRHFLKKHADDSGKPKRLGPGVLEALCHHDWPGNVRELENVVERAIVLSPGHVIGAESLPENVRRVVASIGTGGNGDGNGHKTGEQLMIEESLRRFRGDKSKAARFIGWNRQKLYRKMKGYGIPADYGVAV